MFKDIINLKNKHYVLYVARYGLILVHKCNTIYFML